jgi:thiol:disulfide interchange protein DsbC
MNKWSALLLWSAVAATSVMAADVSNPATHIKEKLEAHFDGAKVEKVQPAPWPGLYEVVTNGDVVYVNEQATLLFSGRILDIDSKQDLTTKRWNALHPADIGKLPLELAIKTVHGAGSRQLFIFADPFCPYCRQLEQQLADVDDVTIYTFLFPLEDIHPGATRQAAKIWCSTDRAGTWSDWMLRQAQPLGANNCDPRALTSTHELGMTLVINSTPTLFFADGHRVGGAISKERLEKEFSAAQLLVSSSGGEPMRVAQ